jgi:hypothetical protein
VTADATLALIHAYNAVAKTHRAAAFSVGPYSSLRALHNVQAETAEIHAMAWTRRAESAGLTVDSGDKDLDALVDIAQRLADHGKVLRDWLTDDEDLPTDTDPPSYDELETAMGHVTQAIEDLRRWTLAKAGQGDLFQPR